MKKYVYIFIVLLIACFSNIAKAEIEPNDDFISASLLSLNSQDNGVLIYPDGDDWWKVQIVEDGSLTISTSSGNDVCVVAYLYDQEGTIQLANTWSPPCTQLDKSMTYSNLTPGFYYIKCQRYNGGGNYSITSSFTAATLEDDFDNNDSISVAKTLPLNNSETGHLGYYGNNKIDLEDWWKITTDEDGNYSATITSESTGCFYLYLYDSDGKTLLKDNYYLSCSAVEKSINYPNLAAGTYFIRCYRYNGYGSYTLTQNLSQAIYQSDIESNDSVDLSIELPLQDSVTGRLGYYGNAKNDNDDWWKFTTADDGSVTLSLKSELTGCFFLYLYDQDKQTLLSNNYWMSCSTLDKYITFPKLASGTYYLRVNRYNGYGSYSLSARLTAATMSNDEEMNDVVSKSKALPLNDSLTGRLGYYGNGYTDLNDWWLVTLPDDGSLTINTHSDPTICVVSYLYDQDSVSELTNTWAPSCSQYDRTMVYTHLKAGTYFVKCYRYNDGYGSYKIKTIFNPSSLPTDIEFNDSIEIAQEIQPNDSLTARIGYYGEKKVDNNDWFKIKVSKKGKLTFNTISDNTACIVSYMYASDSVTQITNTWAPPCSAIDRIMTSPVISPGTYFVNCNLYYSGGYGPYIIKTHFEQVPEPSFNFITNIKSVTFIDSSKFATSYKWDFGDGNFSNAVNPNHVYALPGVYEVKLIVSNNVGSDTIIKQVSIRGLQSIVSNKAGNNGFCTAQINGGGLTEDAKVKLIKEGGNEIFADTVYKVSAGTLSVVFDLNNVQIGIYDVIVEIPEDSAMIIKDGFTVESAIPADIWFNVSGRDRILYNRWQTYTFNYGNNGNNDAYVAPVWLVVSDVPGMELEFLSMKINTPNDTTHKWGVIKDSIPVYFTIDSLNGKAFKARVYPLIIPTVPANYSGSFTVRIKTPSDIEILTWVNPDYNSDEKTSDYESCVMWAQAKALADGIVNIIGSQVPGAECLASVSKTLYGLAYNDNSLGSGLYKITEAGISCAFDLGSELPFFKAYELAWGIYKLAAGIYEAWGDNEDCKKKFKRDKPQDKKIRAVASFDPNEIIGPNGYGESNYYTINADYNYQIYFENKSSATAPAQEVVVYDTIDKTKFDLQTFSFDKLNFNDTTIHIPLGSQEYSVDVDLRPEKELIVRITARLDTVNGVAKWQYLSLDPQTMDLTEDPEGGFLPPNVLSPQGEGFVSFVVSPLKNLNDGSVIKNKASIFFDLNAPIETNVWSNIIDAKYPVSKINELNHEVYDTVFMVSWGGDDDGGSGIQYYQVYYQKDDEPVVLWKNNTYQTEALFTGIYGSSYRFYSIASDSLGNIEPSKSIFDTYTSVLTSVNDIQKHSVVNLDIYPNPANESVFIDLYLCKTDRLDLKVYDIYGKLILFEDYGLINAGKHHYLLPVGNFKNGLYTLVLSTQSGKMQKKIVINK